MLLTEGLFSDLIVKEFTGSWKMILNIFFEGNKKSRFLSEFIG